MKLKIVIKSIFGATLFELEKEDNTIKDTLIEAIKSSADLCDANLRNANLSDADLSDANLRSADLCGADLSSADLRSANLCSANLRSADLCSADLCDANLRNANLSDANLRNANLRNANLSDADLSDAKNIPFIPMNLPEGEFIAWKKLPNGLIAKLKILEDSKRSRAGGDKCRCDKAMVVEFQNIDGTKSKETEYISNQYAKCVYEVGKIVYADSWDENRWYECSHGIHFFIDRQSAVNYQKAR